MLKTFIDRPVLATVISISITILGIIGLTMLPVEQYPNIAPPTVRISTFYSGANAEVVMNSVIIPIEEEVNGVEGMTYMTSTADNNGLAQIEVFFEQDVDPDIATVNVQNRVARATPILPDEVTRTGVTVQKQQSSNIMFLSIMTKNPQYNSRFVQNYANINVIPQIQRVNGVGSASIFGSQDYSMRIWLKPDVMASYKISPMEIIASLQDQSIEAAPGELGQNSNQTYQYTLKYTGRLKSAEEFENIIVHSVDGHILRVKDVADVELGSLNYTVATSTDGYESIMMGISQTAGSNAQQVINDVLAVIKEAEATLPPGIEIVQMQNANDFLDASIKGVLQTLVEAFILVFLVVLIFLQDLKSTIIPAIAVPVSIIGTFFFLVLFGFSVNLLTLFALLLAIGIVVDDAIVVVEAVHAQLDAGEQDPRKATMNAITEIAPAIISITLVMASVFIPVSFIPGTAGIFFKQFGLTLCMAILLSAVNALTLSPALCALFLKPHNKEDGEKSSFIKRFYYGFNILFSSATQKYKNSLQFLGRKGNRWITVAIIGVSVVLLVFLMRMIPTGFVPQEDSGGVLAIVTLSPGASLERSQAVVQELIDIIDEIDDVEHSGAITGVNFMSGIGSSYATLIIKMKHWDERDMSSGELQQVLQKRTAHIKDANFLIVGMPTLQGFGMSAGVELQMQDRTGGDINKFYGVTQDFINALQSSDEVMMAMTNFNPAFPQKEIHADIAKIKAAGLTLTDVMTSMQAYIGSMYISNFNLYGKQFRIMLQASPEYRKSADDLHGLYVKTKSGEMAPITEFIELIDVTGPQAINRFNMYSAMDVTIIPNMIDGHTSGDVMNRIKELEQEYLPVGYGYEYSGMSREEAGQEGQTTIIFAICLIFVYLLLSALYESYIIPLAVIFSLPIGLAGVFVFIFFAMTSGTGIINNIYVQISIVMLIGLLAKNAILIVEYAVQRREQGMSIVDAAVNGAVARFRPILMTSFAFIFGLSPLMFSSGAGAIGNKSIGFSAIGGMLIGTIIGIFVIPSLYIIFQVIEEKVTKSGTLSVTDKSINEE